MPPRRLQGTGGAPKSQRSSSTRSGAQGDAERGESRFLGGFVPAANPVLRKNLQGHEDSLQDSADVKEFARVSRTAQTGLKRLRTAGTLSSLNEVDPGDDEDPLAESFSEAKESKAFKLLDRISGVTHHLTVGHKDKVTCVCSDIGGDCIVSGSMDGTARLWMYDDKDSDAYVLYAVIEHPTRKAGKKAMAAVTAAAVIEGEAMLATGTTSGDVFFTDFLQMDIARCRERLHTGPVRDLAIKNHGMETIAINIETDSDNHIGVKILPEDRGFRVLEVVDGAVKRWNTDNPSQAIQAGDVLLQVNDRDLRKMAADSEDPDKVMKEELQTKKVELEVWRYVRGHLLVASCGGKDAKVSSLHEVDCSGVQKPGAPYTHCVESTMHHDQDVTQVRFVEDGLEPQPGAWRPTELHIVTASQDGAHIWSFNGARIASLAMDGACTLSMAIPIRDESVLVTAGEGKLCVWDIEAIRKLHADRSATVPVIPQREYTHKSGNIDVTLWGEFIVDANQHRCCMWPVMDEKYEPNLDSDSPNEPLLNRLIQNRDHKIIKMMLHKSPVSVLRIVEDPTDGGVLVSGCEDGRVVVWDLEGDDRGEVIARLRSLRASELFGPILALFISFAQMSSFAFGPAVHWRKSVAKPTSFLTPLLRLNLVLLLGGSPAVKFWGSTISVLVVMVIFVVIVLSDGRKKLKHQINQIMSDEQFMNEFDHRRKNVNQKKKKSSHSKKSRKDRRGPGGSAHRKIWIVKTSLKIVNYLLQGCCSVLVVPMATSLAQALSCERDAHGRLGVIVAPEIECFVGPHWHLVVCIAAIAPLYFFLLFPFALVKGDADYVQRTELHSPKAWKHNAMRKATVIHLGPMHPAADNVFVAVCSEIACKIALPLCAKLTITDPVLQMSLITPIGFYMLVITYWHQPLIEDFWNTLLLGSRLWTFCAMVCAFFVTLFPYQLEPVIALAFCSVAVFAGTCIKAKSAPLVMDHTKVIRMDAGGARVMRPHEAENP